jgi:Cys-tRNA(Pro) deacylase
VALEGRGRLERLLREAGVDSRIITFSGHVKTVSAAVKNLGVDPGRIVKSVVFIDDSGSPVVVLVQGNRRVSEVKLARLLGAKWVRIAKPEEAKRHTGYEVGALPPVGLPEGVRVVIDEQVMGLERVYGGGGDVNALLEISPQDIQRLTSGLVGDISFEA